MSSSRLRSVLLIPALSHRISATEFIARCLSLTTVFRLLRKEALISP